MSQGQINIQSRPPIIAIAMLSMCALSYEVLLMRLFSIIQWYHFAYMIISVALLGYGASGAVLTLGQVWMQSRVRLVFMVNIILFAFSSLICFELAQSVPFSPLEILWDREQWFWLFVVYMTLFLPFLFVATSLGLVFRFYSHSINRVYAADLLGAGLGAFAVIALLFSVLPLTALKIVASIAILSAMVASLEMKLSRYNLPVLGVSVILLWIIPTSWLSLTLSEYKELSQTLNITGARVVDSRSSPLGQLTVVENPVIPFRHAPGLSLYADQEPPPQVALFTDGDGMTTITQYDGNPDSVRYLGQSLSALPYQMLENPSVLVLGAGGGTDVLQALYFDAALIDAVELNPQVIDIVSQDYGTFSGNIYQNPRVRLHLADARGYVNRSTESYDLIQLSLLDSFSASSAGLYSLNESYLYTLEAIGEYLDHVSQHGMVSLTRWIKLPPRDMLKLFATAVEVLEHKGFRNPAQHLVMVRNWNNGTLLLKKDPFSELEIDRIKSFTQDQGFDLVFYPGISAEETNRFAVLEHEDFYHGVLAILGQERQDYYERYKYDIEPASDDRPFFFHFFKWRLLGEIRSLPSNQGILLLEWGTLVVGSTLSQALIASAVLILIPLWLQKRKQLQAKVSKEHVHLKVFMYFSAIGLAFMFIEVAFIQKFILFLSHPLYAAAVVLSAFLIFAGLGSALMKRFVTRFSPLLTYFAIVVISLFYVLILPWIFDLLLGLPDSLKILATWFLIAPLAFFMGMPFPLGLDWLAKTDPAIIPWAWGVNGCASVISAVLATLLAMGFGFNVVILLAVSFYVLAMLSLSTK